MKKFFFAIALLTSASAQIHAEAVQSPKVYTELAATPSNPREAEIAALFTRWNAALASGDADQVTALYASDAMLKPTVSNQVRTTPAEIHEYFQKFLKSKPQGVINYRQIRLLGDDAALDTGVYTFTLHQNGKVQTVQARYSFVYKKEAGAWKILSHHSSAMPESAVK